MYYPCSENKGADQFRGNTAQLICVFVFAYAKSRISHNKVHIPSTNKQDPNNTRQVIHALNGACNETFKTLKNRFINIAYTNVMTNESDIHIEFQLKSNRIP